MAAPLLLVHGAWHGGWCYASTVEALARNGLRATAIDLPGHDGARQPGWGIGLEDYAQAVVAAARAQREPVHAVGHSMGGIVISRAAELAPDAFASLVFLAAFLPRAGDSLFKLGQEDGGSQVASATRLNLFGGRIEVVVAKAAPVFYNTCTPEQIAFATSRLRHQSIRPLTEVVKITAARFGAIKRSYLLCRQDRAISYDFQQRLIARTPCAAVGTLDADHSPFLCQPDQTAAALGRLIA